MMTWTHGQCSQHHWMPCDCSTERTNAFADVVSTTYQSLGSGVHDSVEDAKMALKLAQWECTNGPTAELAPPDEKVEARDLVKLFVHRVPRGTLEAELKVGGIRGAYLYPFRGAAARDRVQKAIGTRGTSGFGLLGSYWPSQPFPTYHVVKRILNSDS